MLKADVGSEAMAPGLEGRPQEIFISTMHNHIVLGEGPDWTAGSRPREHEK